MSAVSQYNLVAVEFVHLIEFCISGYLQVHFLVKSPVPENHEEKMTFIQRLASVGVNLENYRKAYDANDVERLLNLANAHK